MHRARVLAVVAVSLPAAAASADPALPLEVLIGAFGGGHGGGPRAPHGWFLGADTGWAWLVGSADVAARTNSDVHDNAWSFGARAGYQLRSGLAVQARFDKLGVTAPDLSGEVMTASFGVRYSMPIVPMPFAEAMVGPAFHGAETSPSAGVGIGVSLAAARHVVFDASLRDWLVDIGGVHHVPTVTLGLSAGFGG